jgi:hypothetical protein
MKLKSTGVLLKNFEVIDDKVGEQRRPILVSWHEQQQIITCTDERNVTCGEAFGSKCFDVLPPL